MVANKTPQWLDTVTKKREASAQAIAPFLHGRGDNDEFITSINDTYQLATLIAEGKLKAYDVTLAYVHRAIAAHQKTNCLTEILFEDALRQARSLDDYYAHHGKTVGPLHGVPMTLKDQFNVRGYDTTLGYVGRAFKPAAEDAVIVKILKDSGVVFFAKTNLPQSIMWCETENPLWGLTTNPNNSDFTPGGSTGGESALLALHGSTVGWGTDIGGSVRIPAHMTGIYGFKPSSSRLPYQGVPVSTEGQEHVPSAVGPMARSLSSIHMVVKQIIQAQPWKNDPRVDPLPWNENAYTAIQTRPLVIGLLLDDGVVRVHPSVERVVKEVAERLEKKGHKVVRWTPDGHDECIRVMDLYYTADGGQDIKHDMAAGGEPYLPHVEALVNRAPAISVYEYWALNRAKREAQRAYLKKWQAIRDQTSDQEVDILLTPVMPHPAVPHRKCKWVGYTKVWNLLDYTALVLPAGKVDKLVDPAKDDGFLASYSPRNDLDRWNWDLYDPETTHGMPIGVQIVGKRLEEEKVLGAAKVIDDILKHL